MNKEKWITPQVTVLGIEGTEATYHTGEIADLEYCDHKAPLYS